MLRNNNDNCQQTFALFFNHNTNMIHNYLDLGLMRVIKEVRKWVLKLTIENKEEEVVKFSLSLSLRFYPRLEKIIQVMIKGVCKMPKCGSRLKR